MVAEKSILFQLKNSQRRRHTDKQLNDFLSIWEFSKNFDFDLQENTQLNF